MAPPPVETTSPSAELVPARHEDPSNLSATHLRKYLATFRHFDNAGVGVLSGEALRAALARHHGGQLSAKDFAQLLSAGAEPAESSTSAAGGDEPAAADAEDQLKATEQAQQADGPRPVIPQEKDVTDFCRWAHSLSNHKVKAGRNPRAYMTPDDIDTYTGVFRERAKDGRLDAKELEELFSKYSITLSEDRAVRIMREVDEENSGLLDENEFLALLSRVMDLKKRTVGPGSCPLAQLAREGWSASELRKLGYDYAEFEQYGGFPFSELLEVFGPLKLRRAGVPLKTMVQHGWDFSKAREAGFAMKDLLAAGCPPRRIWDAGWTEPTTAAQLRTLGVDAGKLRAAGWELSELRTAGYTGAELRLAGFAAHAVACVDQLLQVENGDSQRRGTFELRQLADEDVAEAMRLQAEEVTLAEQTPSKPQKSVVQTPTDKTNPSQDVTRNTAKETG